MTTTNVTVQETRILGSKVVILSAWVPAPLTAGGYTTVTTIDGVWHGKMGTEKLPADLDALRPGSQERMDSVRAWVKARRADAVAIIREQRPEAASGRDNGMGEVELAEGSEPEKTKRGTEVAYRLPGRGWRTKTFKTEGKAFHRFVEKQREEGAEIRTRDA